MIKKFRDKLFNEILWYKKKIETGKLKYFGNKNIGDANSFLVILNDGSYFYIGMGTDNIPNISKKQVMFISKEMLRHNNRLNKWYRDSFDSDRGYYCYEKNDRYGSRNYIIDRMKKYNVIYENQLDTGTWD